MKDIVVWKLGLAPRASRIVKFVPSTSTPTRRSQPHSSFDMARNTMAFGPQLKPWLWLLPIVHICCAGNLSLSGIDAETFEQRALAPGIFVMACTLAPHQYFIRELV
jgi:hypothetical protein